MANDKIMPARNSDGTIKTDPHFETPRATYPDGSKGDATHAVPAWPRNPDGSRFYPKVDTGPVFNADGSVRSHNGGENRPVDANLLGYPTYPGDPRNPNDPKFPGTAAGPVAGAVVGVDDQKLSAAGSKPVGVEGPSVTPQMGKARALANPTTPAVKTNP